MSYNSIYGNTFKLPGQNNLLNIPDFFFKLMVRIQKSEDKKKKILLNRSQNKREINSNLQSDENIKNNALIKKYDLIPNKKSQVLYKRKNSAFNILKLRKRKKINEDDKDELIVSKKEEKSKEINITEKSKISDMKTLTQKNFRNKSFYGHVPHNNYDINYSLQKKNLASNIPNLAKQQKIFNNKLEYEKKFKENYANLRNFLGHLYFMKNKYRLNKTLTQNLILGNSNYNGGSSNNDDFKEQVNNLFLKLNLNININIFI